MRHQGEPVVGQLSLQRTGACVARRAVVARGWWARLRGLLGRSALAPDAALILPQCNAIHTWGMRFGIDALFVDRAWRVVGLRERIRPGGMVWPVWRAWGVVELPADTLARLGVVVGDQLHFAHTQEVQ